LSAAHLPDPEVLIGSASAEVVAPARAPIRGSRKITVLPDLLPCRGAIALRRTMCRGADLGYDVSNLRFEANTISLGMFAVIAHGERPAEHPFTYVYEDQSSELRGFPGAVCLLV